MRIFYFLNVCTYRCKVQLLILCEILLFWNLSFYKSRCLFLSSSWLCVCVWGGGRGSRAVSSECRNSWYAYFTFCKRKNIQTIFFLNLNTVELVVFALVLFSLIFAKRLPREFINTANIWWVSIYPKIGNFFIQHFLFTVYGLQPQVVNMITSRIHNTLIK
jgi:hypothetical protein